MIKKKSGFHYYFLLNLCFYLQRHVPSYLLPSVTLGVLYGRWHEENER